MLNKNSLLALSVLLLLAFACANPAGGTSVPQPTQNIETMVAATFSGLTAFASGNAAPLSTPQPADSTASLLPHPLLYLANDAAQIQQVYRLERDGKTITQITFEPVKVEDYDVSLADGSLVFLSNNQLFLVDSNGSNRKVIVSVGPRDENDPYTTSIRRPVFSPNGQTIAYGYQGLNFYAVASGVSNRTLEDKVEDFGGGLIVLSQGYTPERYSSDGSKLLLTLQYYEGASSAIYYPASNSLVGLSNAEGAFICCGEPEWTADNSSLFIGNPSMGMFTSGLWQIDASTGNVTTLIPGDPGNGTFNFADEAYFAPDGQLYFFYTNLPITQEFYDRVPLQLVRSNADGVTNRIVLRPETFETMNEALWAPDASFVIAANSPSGQVYFGGAAELYYTDGQKAMVPLLPYAQIMKWGP